MAKFNYTELFYSLQGEGRYMGVPSIFLRMFGCNFRCKNFGRYQEHILGDDVTHNPEVVEVIKNIKTYKTFDELPLVTTGCDSYTSVYPEFKEFAMKSTEDELAQKIVDLLPYKRWMREHLVITGGEPLLGWQRSYPSLLGHDLMAHLREITFETNGTQRLTEDFKKYLETWTDRDDREITFSVSAKLPGSGERWEDAIKPDIVCQYQTVGNTYLKFVVATEQDVNHALAAIITYRDEGFTGEIYLMPVGGTVETYFTNTKKIAETCMRHGLRYSARLQCDLFKNAWGT